MRAITLPQFALGTATLIITRLPSNLSPTTRECVHLVTHDHFWSRDKDGGHPIRSVISQNPMLHTKTWLYVL